MKGREAMAEGSRRPAVLFDIDGTLVDSNYLHVQAWTEAMERVGTPVDGWRVHRAIGLDSAKLLDALLQEKLEQYGDQAKKVHSDLYQQLVDRLRVFDGSRELLKHTRDSGLQVVLSTSAPEDELKNLRAVLDVEDLLDHVTSAEDVEQAKPDPDILQVSLKRAGVPADRAVMIGDTVWDGEACKKAGVTFVGVLSGGISEAELRRAGAVAVYEGPADLLANFGDSPLGELLGS
jgi:HAD superfamily hydrolase (TIGR01509 family)